MYFLIHLVNTFIIYLVVNTPILHGMIRMTSQYPISRTGPKSHITYRTAGPKIHIKPEATFVLS